MNLIRRIILALVFVLPFAVFTKGFYGTVFAKYAFIVFTTLLVGSLFLIGKIYKKEKENIIPKNISFFVFGIYVLTLLISGLSGVLPSLSFWSSFDQGTGILFMICLFCFSLITSSVFKTKEDWKKLFTYFVFSGIIFSIASWMSLAGVRFSKFLDLNMHSGFTIGNSSWTGIFIALVFFVSLGLAFSSVNKKQKIIGIVGMITSFFDPILTGFIIQAPGASFGPIGLARTGSYSLYAGIGLFLLYLIYRKIVSTKWRKIFVGSFLALSFLGFIFVSTIGRGHVRDFIAEKAGPNRLVFWSIATEGFKEKPILGWGGDSYQYVYGKYFDPIIFTEGYAPEYWVDRSHNIYFDELSSGGIVGFIGLVTLYGMILFGLSRKAILSLDREGLFYMALASGVISFLIQGLMLFQTITGWFIIAIIIAFVSNTCFKDRSNIKEDDTENNKKKKNIKNKDTDQGFNLFISSIVIVVAFTAFIYLVVKPYKINKGLAQFPSMSYSERLEFFKKLENAYVGNNVDLGNAFSPYHVRLRDIFKSGLKEEEKMLMINEINVLNNLIENSSVRQKDMDVKLLMTNVGFYSILAGIAPDEDRKMYYDKGILNVNKIIEVSDKNPIVKLSKSIMDVSFKYGEDGVNAFDTSKKKE